MMSAASNTPVARSAIVIDGTPGNAISGGGAASLLTTSHVLAERAQGMGHRELRPDRIAVGASVRAQEKALATADRVF